MTGMGDVAEPRRYSAGPAWGAVLEFLRAAPFTIAIASALVVVAVLERPLFGTMRMLRWDMGFGFEPLLQEGHWWSAVTALFVTTGPGMLAVDVVLTIGLLGAAERLLGTWRTAVAFFATGVAGGLAGVGLQWLGSASGEFWSRHTLEFIALDPLTPVAGALMAASASASVLWRRRIRLLTPLAAVVLLLYSGQPADLYRLLATAAGLGLGVLLRPGEKRILHWARGTSHEIRVLLAAATAITAIGPVAALVSGSRFGPLAPITQLLTQQVPNEQQALAQCQAFRVTHGCIHLLTLVRINSPGAILVSIGPLALLLVAAYGLLRGRRLAVWLAVGVNVMLGVLSAFYYGFLPVSGLPYALPHRPGANWEVTLYLLLSVLVPLALAAALILARRNFRVLPTRRQAVGYPALVAGVALALAAVYVGGGLLLRDTAFTSAVGLPDLLGDVFERFLPVSFLRRETIEFLPSTTAGGILYYGIGPLFWAATIAGAFWALGGAGRGLASSAASQVRKRLLAGGGDTLAFMATWPGNSHWADPGGRGMVAYRVVGRIALTLGGPFGSHAGHEGAMGRFARFCDENGWTPVFYSAPGSYQGYFTSIGWHSMVVAQETVLRPAGWNTTGKKWQDVRTAVNKARKSGMTAVWSRWSDLPIGTANQIAEISEQWVSDKALPEMGFTLGGLEELRDPEVRLMLAIDAAGQVQAVTSWLPSWRDGRIIGWTLDFMRRRADSSNGVMEFVIAETAASMQDSDIEFLSLSGAPLAHTSQAGDAQGIERLLGYLSASLEPVYGFRSLLKFKRKFQPELHPMIMAYPDAAALPTIGIALTRAYLPQLSPRSLIAFARAGH